MSLRYPGSPQPQDFPFGPGTFSRLGAYLRWCSSKRVPLETHLHVSPSHSYLPRVHKLITTFAKHRPPPSLQPISTRPACCPSISSTSSPPTTARHTTRLSLISANNNPLPQLRHCSPQARRRSGGRGKGHKTASHRTHNYQAPHNPQLHQKKHTKQSCLKNPAHRKSPPLPTHKKYTQYTQSPQLAHH